MIEVVIRCKEVAKERRDRDVQFHINQKLRDAGIPAKGDIAFMGVTRGKLSWTPQPNGDLLFQWSDSNG